MHEAAFHTVADDAALAREIALAAPGRAPAAEAELCRRLYPRIRLYGLRHLRDRHAAVDLAQNVLEMTLERLRAGKLRDPEKLVSFVLGMCRMVVLDLRRGAARRERLLEAYAIPEEGAEPEEAEPFARQRLAGCLEALAERERLVLVLSFYSDKSAQEVGSELGLSQANVRVIRHRALQRLRECVSPEGGKA